MDHTFLPAYIEANRVRWYHILPVILIITIGIVMRAAVLWRERQEKADSTTPSGIADLDVIYQSGSLFYSCDDLFICVYLMTPDKLFEGSMSSSSSLIGVMG